MLRTLPIGITIIIPRMNDNCITKVVGFRRIAMGSLVRRYIVTKGQIKPLFDACIIFPREDDAPECHGMAQISGQSTFPNLLSYQLRGVLELSLNPSSPVLSAQVF